MKIISFIGTRKSSDSNTLKLLNLITKELEKQIDNECEILHKSYTPNDLEIRSCKGCLNCFMNGFCPLDKYDKFDRIKRDLMDADIVILGSPVYAGTISGDMKIFIDRLSYWLHIMPLAGKRGIMLITASSNSIMETGAYLHRIMETLGLCVICDVSCTVDYPKMLSDSRFINITIPSYIKKVISSLKSETLEPSNYQNIYFKKIQESYDSLYSIENAEFRYWNSKKINNYNSFKDYINNVNTGGKE